MREISKCLSRYHREAKIDYDKKYSISSSKDDLKIERNYCDKHDTKVESDYSSKNNTRLVKIYNEEIKVKSKDDLRKSLKSYRLHISKKEGIQPYMVFNNDTMEELIIKRPKSLYELRNIKGFGPVKC